MNNILSFIEFLDPGYLIQYGGLTLLLLIIFAENGIIFGIFLPGDSLLFVSGLLSETPYLDINIRLLVPMLVLAAVCGSTAGYFTGKWSGAYMASRKETFFYKRRYADMTREFYQKHGMWAFVIGRFLPVVRTFVPILAGMAGLRFSKFIFVNFIGAAVWITVMVVAGHSVGNVFPSVIDYLDLIVGGMVVLTSIPLVVMWRRQQGESNA